ncbi:MAG TPA: hypothetical protein VF461_23335 [Gemmatimonadaceae bacterium]
MTREQSSETAGTLALVRACVRAWTNHDFDAAADRRADDLRVEVAIDAAPTQASFAETLDAFGRMVDGVIVLDTSAGAHRTA